jgi:hypothetical protein
MKAHLIPLLSLFLVFGWGGQSEAQIRDNEASANVLAVQCAVSSGFSTQDYEEYCRSLAKTLSRLSPAQQVKVFGYLPVVAGSNQETGGENSSPNPTYTPPAPAPVEEPVEGTPLSPNSGGVTRESGAETTTTSSNTPGSEIPVIRSGNEDAGSNSTNSGSGNDSTKWDSLLERILGALRETVEGAEEEIR